MADTPVVSIHDFIDAFVGDDEALLAARARAAALGCQPPGPAAGATLRFLASVLAARAVVEVGTCTGVSGLYLLRGMRPNGVLTTVDLDAEHSRAARVAFAEAGFGSHRARLITGVALDVLPRLTDGGYDLVHCATVTADFAEYLREATRLLRPGGVVLFGGVLHGNRLADPAARDPRTVASRELARLARDHADLVPVLLPVSDGLLAASYQPPES